MRGGTNHRGYTIVEVLIFMAVSGFMFIVAAGFVSGKQSKAEFKQGVNAINSQIRQITNDVGNGYFPTAANFSCSTSSAAGDPPSFSVTPKNQGANQGCVFIGKVIQFAPQGTNGGGYNVFTIAGRQYKTTAVDNTAPSTFAETAPKPVVTPVDLTERLKVEWGVTITKAGTGANDPHPNQTISGIGFFKSFGSYDTGGTLNSGSQDIVVVPIYGSLNYDPNTFASDLPGKITDANADSTPNIIICFESGKNQYGTLTLGGANGQKQRLTSVTQISNSASVCPLP